LLAAAENRTVDFYTLELEARRAFGFPPFQRMAMLRFQHRHEKKVEQFACEVVQYIHAQVQKHKVPCSVLGPAVAPLSRLKNLYRWQCLVKSESVKDLQAVLKGVQEYAVMRKSSVQMAVDVDPINSL
jgi:primosomal protein N' (replication factor Y)